MSLVEDVKKIIVVKNMDEEIKTAETTTPEVAAEPTPAAAPAVEENSVNPAGEVGPVETPVETPAAAEEAPAQV